MTNPTDKIVEAVVDAIIGTFPKVQAHNDEDLALLSEAAPHLARAAILAHTQALVDDFSDRPGDEFLDACKAFTVSVLRAHMEQMRQ